MRTQVLERMLPQAEALAREDAAMMESARQRLLAAELELKEAREEMDLVAGKSRSSNSLVEAIREQLKERADAGAKTGPPETEDDRAAVQSPRVSVAESIRILLRERGEATLAQITEHIKQVRPDVNSRNTRPELSRMTKRGELVRPCVGSYRLSTVEATTGT